METPLTYLYLMSFTVILIGAVNIGQICKETSDSRIRLFSKPGLDVICTGSLPDYNRLRLPNQCNDENWKKKVLQLISVNGTLHKHSLELFPMVRTILIYRSKIDGFISPLKFGTALHIAESTFPNITSELLVENRYFSTLGLHSNPNLTIGKAPFKHLFMLKNLIIYNQSLPQLEQDFLLGLNDLEKMILNWNNLTEIHEEVFQNKERLRIISLAHNPLEKFTPKLHYLKRIEQISLADTRVLQISLRIFFPVRSLTTLELPSSTLSRVREMDLIHMAISFPNLKCIFWNSMMVEDSNTVETLLKNINALGLVVVDTMDIYSSDCSICVEVPARNCTV